jgi:hypothetical protein
MLASGIQSELAPTMSALAACARASRLGKLIDPARCQNPMGIGLEMNISSCDSLPS